MQESFFWRRAKTLIAGLGFLLGVAPAMAQGAAAGWWMDQSGKAGIVIAPCGKDLCGRIEWLKVPMDKAGRPKTDIHNSNAALKPRPLCGLQILGNFIPDGQGGWKGGWIYDPQNGETYKSVMHVVADGTLHVRGYIGIPLLGRSEVWRRPANVLPACSGG
ncbi:MAG: DUF2147 domain-containing protein [Rhodospirillales bacterium]|nr:DUF2147 domain-containing protein [Rhodospirillales bacterium]